MSLKLIYKTVTYRTIDHVAIGREARSRRLQLSLSLAYVSKFTGISISMLSHLETGQRRWTAKYLNAVNDALYNLCNATVNKPAKPKKGKA